MQQDDLKMLSNVSKMPGRSISRSAWLCKTGSKLAKIPGTVCHGCYARKGMYHMPNVKNKMIEREEFFHAIDFVPRMIRVLGRIRKPEFRWFDSGDVEDVRMALNILDICEATPDKIHWIPSKEPKIWADALALRNNKLPDNVTLRMSATKVDGPPPRAWSNTSTVTLSGNITGHACPAPKQEGECGSCRACWDRSVPNVTYHKH